MIKRVLFAIGIIGAINSPASAKTSEAGQCRSVSQGRIIDAPNGVKIGVRTVGNGKPVLMIPSLGRGVADFDEVAGRLVAEGFMTILPEPRGINGSTGPNPVDLFDLAGDLAAVLKMMCSGKVDVVGHAFGNRVARSLAAAHPQLVGRVILLAGGGAVPLTDPIRAALEGSYAQGSKPDADRLKDLQLAFFAVGNEPSRWLSGWFPAAAKAQVDAVRSTSRDRWWQAGESPLLLVQAAEDPIAPPGNSDILKKEVGSRLTEITLRHASHAILPEQPAAVAMALKIYLGSHALPSEEKLQSAVDRATVPRAR